MIYIAAGRLGVEIYNFDSHGNITLFKSFEEIKFGDNLTIDIVDVNTN